MVGLYPGEDWAQSLTHEWLVTDGLGGYASGTVLGPNTRRYHGLLVAPLAPPLGRHVLLAKVEETLVAGNGSFALSANEFHDGTIHPRGFEHLVAFRLDEGVPVWDYRAAGMALEKRLWMERGHTATYLSYALAAGGGARLDLTPLCCFRDFHRETIGSEDWHFRVEVQHAGGEDAGSLAIVAFPGATPYYLHVIPPPGRRWSFVAGGGWWWQFLHRAERDRGLDCVEDLYAIGRVMCDLGAGERLVLVASLSPRPPALTRGRGDAETRGGSSSPGSLADAERGNEGHWLAPAGTEAQAQDRAQEEEALFVAQLRRAGAQFLVARAVPGEPAVVDGQGVPEARTVLAGYHWFGDWGRDTMIALPGLAMATGRWREAAAILRAFARYVDRGMLPNRFPDTGAPLGDGDYNTVDATLWYFHAIDAVDRLRTDDPGAEQDLVRTLWPVLAEIVDWHVRGTRFGIGVDPADGLVYVQNPQLTWMDAKVGEWVVTPRAGKPVEIAALWHHALALMERWAERLGRTDDGARLRRLRERAADGFHKRFWYEPGGYLYDVVDGPQGNDDSLRPNQIIAAALPDCPLDGPQRRAVVDVVAAQLWTPRGLRTLAPHDTRYHGRYQGGPWERDSAYHQGTVWPWLLGPFVDAHLLVYRDPAAARRFVEPLRDHLFDEACVGSVSEIFDGDAPHAPRGCIAQAWSVAEVFRAWMATSGSAAPGSLAPAWGREDTETRGG
jgi:glycogen debranching enzyme